MFQGPTPVLVESCDVNDLALLLRENKKETSNIPFGANQAILVQSKEAKDNLPSIFSDAIGLTIFEAKGLEFDDVLLHNFFSDSMVSICTYYCNIIDTDLLEYEITYRLMRKVGGLFLHILRCHNIVRK